MGLYSAGIFESKLVGDVILPSQYRDLITSSTMEPEKRLMLAVLEDAVDCYTKHYSSKGRVQRAIFKDAEDWILSGEEKWPFSYRVVCDVLSIDSDALLSGLKGLVENKIKLKSYRER